MAMSVVDLEERLAGVAAAMVQRGLVLQKSQDGLPWAFTVAEAAQFLGLSQLEVRGLVKRRVLPSIKLHERVIAAVHVRRFKAQQHR